MQDGQFTDGRVGCPLSLLPPSCADAPPPRQCCREPAENAGQYGQSAISQSWAVLSGTAPRARAEHALDGLRMQLMRRDSRVIQLLAPPFDKSALDPGCSRGYPPGVRENGGQYIHAALLTAMAIAQMGSGDEAVELFHMLSPINHRRISAARERYEAKSYAVAADVYTHPAHIGRGGWTWYTGSAALMYRLRLASILRLRQRGDSFLGAPCIPGSWGGFRPPGGRPIERLPARCG